jgi:hypothetical protein
MADQIVPAVIRPSDAAAYLNLSIQRLAKLRLEGGGPKFLKVGRSVLYRKQDLDDFLQSRVRKSTSDVG